MNKTLSIGRLTRDPDVSYTKEGKAFAKITLALNGYGEHVDYPRFIAYDQRAEFAEKYLKKGQQVGVEGRIQTGNYINKDGDKVYTTDIKVDNWFLLGKKSDNEKKQSSNTVTGEGFMNIPDAIDEELPFN